MKVYIVYFNTGEYEDAIHQIYKMLSNKNSAEILCKDMNDKLKEMNLHRSSKQSDDAFEGRYSEEIVSLFGYSIDYTGASYSVEGPFNVYS